MDIQRDDVVRAVGEVWETALGIPVVPDDVPTTDGQPTVTGTVNIGGACRAEVALACDAGLARRAAATFFALPEGELTDEMICDAVGELANMTGGQLKALLPEGCTLSPPTITNTRTAERPENGVGFRAADCDFTVAITPRDS